MLIFYTFWHGQKSLPKMIKNRDVGGQKANTPHILGGLAERAGRLGGVRGVEILVKLVKFGIGQKVLVILIWAV